MKFLPLALLALVLAGCTPAPAPPPEVILTSVDPALAQLITTSRQTVVATPQAAEAWGKFGQALHAAEFYPEASASYARALALDPRSARWAQPSFCGTRPSNSAMRDRSAF